MENTYPSALTNYPKMYKFMSLQINVSDKRMITNRETYGSAEYLSDIGGIY